MPQSHDFCNRFVKKVALCYNGSGDTMNDHLVKAYAFGDNVRVYAATTTNLVEHARTIHDLWPTSAAALGRFLTVSAMMGAMYTKDQELTLRVDGDGPIRGMVATANAHGEVRGYVGNPHVFLQYPSGKLDVGQAVGNGQIHVTKDVKIRDTFTSTARIQSGEIGEDFAYYFTASEQIPSAVGVGVVVTPDNRVATAGGFILQRMPGCPDDIIDTIEAALKALPPVSDMLKDGLAPETIIKQLAGDDHRVLASMDLAYACDCSREKFERGLLTLGKKELTSLRDEDGKIDTVCHFCATVYPFDKAAINRLIDETDKA